MIETSLLLYLAPIVLPVVADVIGDILPGKYVGKLRKITRHARLIQKNKGLEERNRWDYNEYEKNLIAIKTMVLSKNFDRVVSQLRANLTILTSASEHLVAQGSPPEIMKEIILALTSQQAAIDQIQEMYNKTLNIKEVL